MYPFPPSPPVNAQAIVLHVVMLGLGLASLAGLWLTRKRNARGMDVIPWALALLVGVVFGIAVISADEHSRPFFIGYTLFVVIVAGLGLIRTYVSLQQQKKSTFGWVTLLALLMLGLMVMCLVPQVPSAREAARRTQCKSNLKQLGLAMLLWQDEHGRFPDAAAPEGEDGPPVSWRVQLLDFLDLRELSQEYDRQQPWDSEPNLRVARRPVSVYACPSNPIVMDDNERFFAAYAAMTGPDTAFPEGRGVSLDAIASTSTTILIGEACGLNIVWTEPRDIDVTREKLGVNLPSDQPRTSPGILSSYHPGGAQVTLADGRARFINQNIDREVLRDLATPDDDGESESF